MPKAYGLPLCGGYVLFMTGGYRAITGTPPGLESQAWYARLLRIVLGVALTIGTIVVGVIAWHYVLEAH